MTANQTKAGAVSNINDWHSVGWREVNQNVRRLQAAYRPGDTGNGETAFQTERY